MSGADVATTPAEPPAGTTSNANGKGKRRPVLPKPDEKAYNDSVEQLKQEIARCEGTLRDIKAALNARSGIRQKWQEERKGVLAKLNEIRAETRRLLEERNQVYNTIAQAQEQNQSNFKSVQQLKKDLPFTSVEEIDKAIHDLEYRQMTEVMDLNEEKGLIGKIAQLEASKSTVKDYNVQFESMKKEREANKSLYDELKAKSAEVSAMRDLGSKQLKLLDEIKAKEQDEMAELPGLHEEHNEVQKKIGEYKQEIVKARNEWREANKRWFEAQKEIRAQQAEEWQKRKQAEMEERRKRMEELDKEKASLQPFEIELALCDSLIGYLEGLKPKKNEKPVEEVKAAPAQPPPPEGMQIIKREEPDAGALFERRKGKGKGKARKEVSKTRITHAVDVFVDFQKLKMTPPLSLAQVDASIEEVKKKKAWYLAQPNPYLKGARKARATSGDPKEEKKEKAEEQKEKQEVEEEEEKKEKVEEDVVEEEKKEVVEEKKEVVEEKKEVVEEKKEEEKIDEEKREGEEIKEETKEVEEEKKEEEKKEEEAAIPEP